MKSTARSPRPCCTARSSRTGEPCRRAPIRGGTVCPTHGGSAPQVLRKADERLADLIDPDRAIREVARVAYSDIRQLFDASGRLLPVHAWPDAAAAAVASIEVRSSGDATAGAVAKLKLWDKSASLLLLFKRLGLLEPEALPAKPRPQLVIQVQCGNEPPRPLRSWQPPHARTPANVPDVTHNDAAAHGQIRGNGNGHKALQLPACTEGR